MACDPARIRNLGNRDKAHASQRCHFNKNTPDSLIVAITSDVRPTFINHKLSPAVSLAQQGSSDESPPPPPRTVGPFFALAKTAYVLLYRLGGVRVGRDGFDFVELRDEISESVVVIIVGVDGEQSMETRTEDIEIALGQQAHCDNTVFRQHSSPGVDKGNGWTANKCLDERLTKCFARGCATAQDVALASVGRHAGADGPE
ncbi:hypothetical protein U1737_17050 [Sphingomonas sp. LB3N6]|uniref:hypothetical protein n=1 Tax=Sphingomonas fucosidasi TaxID=3096164 RepID=UPI002FC7A2D1